MPRSPRWSRGWGTEANGWTNFSDLTGVYGNAYAIRAAVTLAGLGANPPEDAVYPLLVRDADGDPLRGQVDYVLHFKADQLPPVAPFWSLTMYDNEGFQVANELDRFAIGDRDPLVFNPDGSLDLYIQQTNPDPERADTCSTNQRPRRPPRRAAAWLLLWAAGQLKQQCRCRRCCGDNAEARSVLLWSVLEHGFTGLRVRGELSW